ncbi:hypothetical protein EV128_126100 [Rhizobium azibense]|nr:hypothetical protein EV128_126100 [Rhizobium azibense]
MTIARTVRPIHVEDFSGTEFERLVFACHLCDGWTDLAWFGQTEATEGATSSAHVPFDVQPDGASFNTSISAVSLKRRRRRVWPPR